MTFQGRRRSRVIHWSWLGRASMLNLLHGHWVSARVGSGLTRTDDVYRSIAMFGHTVRGMYRSDPDGGPSQIELCRAQAVSQPESSLADAESDGSASSNRVVGFRKVESRKIHKIPKNVKKSKKIWKKIIKLVYPLEICKKGFKEVLSHNANFEPFFAR